MAAYTRRISYIGQIATGASEDRLEKLIAERLGPGAEAAHRLRCALQTAEA